MAVSVLLTLKHKEIAASRMGGRYLFYAAEPNKSKVRWFYVGKNLSIHRKHGLCGLVEVPKTKHQRFGRIHGLWHKPLQVSCGAVDGEKDQLPVQEAEEADNWGDTA